MYATQPALEHREKYIEIDDVRRKQREAREREKEAQLLDSMYKVGVNKCGPGVAELGKRRGEKGRATQRQAVGAHSTARTA